MVRRWESHCLALRVTVAWWKKNVVLNNKIVIEASRAWLSSSYCLPWFGFFRNCIMEEIGALADKDSIDREFRNCVAADGLQDFCFEACEFSACHFSEAGFRRTTFIDCKFVDCDLSMASVDGSVFNGVEFVGCRLLGIDWSRCNGSLFTVSFSASTLDSSVFDGMKLRRVSLQKCSLVGAFFNSSDLQEASFRGSKLNDCSFDGADLRRADFRETECLSLDFSSPKLRGLKLDMAGAVALVRRNGIVVD